MPLDNVIDATVTVAVVYHSGYGHTAKQAEAVKRGAGRIPGVSVLMLTSDEAQRQLEALDGADAIIFGAPTYMGKASAQFCAFMDATSKVFATGAWKDKIAAGFTNSASRSGDKLATLTQFAILAAQLGMHWVSLGLVAGNNSSDGSEEDLNRLGFFLGAAAQSNFDEGPDRAPPPADLRTAEHLGERVARVAQQFVRGRLPAQPDGVREDHLRRQGVER
ncbi:flavodoxin family protein [Dongia sedimenti]|uniref:Flavodoxin family protein n=1 Tax=Dongia sedimenti TaxID=3064282 RepID=A0ABU0YTN3_9PROT|nr:flavodoxin family protein [Rhodospirillaceae bacterium R-7]